MSKTPLTAALHVASIQVTTTQAVKKLKEEHEREIRLMRQLLLEPCQLQMAASLAILVATTVIVSSDVSRPLREASMGLTSRSAVYIVPCTVSAGLKLHDFSRSGHTGLLRTCSSIASSLNDLLQVGRLDCSGSVVDRPP